MESNTRHIDDEIVRKEIVDQAGDCLGKLLIAALTLKRMRSDANFRIRYSEALLAT